MTDQRNDKASNPTGDKVGVYICYCGGNISDHVDVEKVREEMEKLPQVAVARTNMFMCSDPGQELIMDDLKSGAVNSVVVASCAPSLHETTFRRTIERAGANPYMYEHANIREQVSWVHHGDPATRKSVRLVAAAAAKAALLKPLEPIRVQAKPHVTVIGGGPAGLRAALDLAGQGLEVDLVEKSPFLGGQAVNLDRLAPNGAKAVELIGQLTDQVLVQDRIKIHLSAEVIGFEGHVGEYNLKLMKRPPEDRADKDRLATWQAAGAPHDKVVPFAGLCPVPPPTESEEFSLSTGAVVLATGFRPYRPANGEYGSDRFEEVVDLHRLIRGLADSPAGKYLDFEGRPIRSLAMIHCVGSRQIPGIHPEDESGRLNEYCSRTCCSSLLAAANRIREDYPGTRIYEFYRDIRTYGRGQEDLYTKASRNGVVFIRFEAENGPEVVPGGGEDDYPLRVRAIDTLTFNEPVEAPVDLVVLAAGMVPNDVSDLVELMKLPVGSDGFLLEVHPKLRPVELPSGGMLLAGTCQAPMDVGESCNAAGAAAVKAAGLLSRGALELDPFVAEVDPGKCTGCGACLEACLGEGALALVEPEGGQGAKAEVSPAACLGCGACTAVCPENAININGWTLDQYRAMVDMIVAPAKAA